MYKKTCISGPFYFILQTTTDCCRHGVRVAQIMIDDYADIA